MDWDDYKTSLIWTAEKGAQRYLQTGKSEGDFWYAVERMVDNEGYIKVAALILNDAPKGDIRQALEESMFSQKFVERECDRFESMRQESISDAKNYDELGY